MSPNSRINFSTFIPKLIHIFFCPPCNCIPVLASSSLDAAIHLWNVDTGAKIRTFDNGPMDAWTDAFSPCATKLISGSHVGKINLFNTETGEKVQSLDTRNIKSCLLECLFLALLTIFENLFTLLAKFGYFDRIFEFIFGIPVTHAV